jgi:hypothetical protein
LRTVLAGVLVAFSSVALLAACGPDDPLVLSFCRLRPPVFVEPCEPERVLRIPQKYVVPANARSRDVQPGDSVSIDLAVQFPGFRPWRDLPVWRRWFGSGQPVRIGLGRTTTQTVRDIHRIDFLGEPKPVPAPPAFGLVHYQHHTWGTWDIYVPPGEDPALHIRCAADVADDVPACTVRTFTDWGLTLSYHYPRPYLPHWAEIQSQVLGLIRSFQAAR